MAFSVEWRVEAETELARFFSLKHQRTIVNKVEHFAENLPASLSLKSVQPVRDAPSLPGGGRVFELDIGSGPRAGLMVFEQTETIIVYLVGPHDYAHEHFLSAIEQRMP